MSKSHKKVTVEYEPDDLNLGTDEERYQKRWGPRVIARDADNAMRYRTAYAKHSAKAVEKRRGFVGISNDSEEEIDLLTAFRPTDEETATRMMEGDALHGVPVPSASSAKPAAGIASSSKVLNVSSASAVTKDDLEEVKASVARDFVKLLEGINSLSARLETLLATAPPAQVPVDLSGLKSEVAAITKRLDDAAEARIASQKERFEREARDKLAKADRIKREAEEKQKKIEAKKERNRKKKVARKEKSERAKEIRASKEKGENPYSEAETKAYIARLAKSGKTYYTPEQRAEYQRLNPKGIVEKSRARGAAAAKKQEKRKRVFVPYTEAQKTAYVKANFTDKGKKYYSLKERIAHKARRGLPEAS